MGLPIRDVGFVRFRVRVSAYRDVPFIAWSGSVVSSAVRGAIKEVCPDSCVLVSVSPLIVFDRDGAGRILLSGAVEGGRVRHSFLAAGSEAGFEFSLWIRKGSAGAVDVIDALGRGLEALGFSSRSAEFEVVAEPPAVRIPEGGERFIVKVLHGPTIFVFRGWRILYPSPARLIHSAARAYTEIFRAPASDMKRKARVLSRYTELVDSRCRVVELDIGGGRRAKAFTGRAVYGVYGARRAAELLAILAAGEKAGVGKSRGIGFGYMRVEGVEAVG